MEYPTQGRAKKEKPTTEEAVCIRADVAKGTLKPAVQLTERGWIHPFTGVWSNARPNIQYNITRHSRVDVAGRFWANESTRF